ncbi:MAG: TetR family transcriptional regulator, partial [Acetobacteraceae bacterium]
RCDGDPATAAMAMWAMVDGLIRNWMFEPERFDLMKMGQCLIDPYVDGLRLRGT